MTDREGTKHVVGLVVNPVAGMGGSVGLKGTDGGMYEKALELGAEPVTPRRTRDLLTHIRNNDAITWLVAPGEMGEQYVADQHLLFEVVGEIGEETSAQDTVMIARKMIDRGAGLLVFVGGDELGDTELIVQRDHLVGQLLARRMQLARLFLAADVYFTCWLATVERFRVRARHAARLSLSTLAHRLGVLGYQLQHLLVFVFGHGYAPLDRVETEVSTPP